MWYLDEQSTVSAQYALPEELMLDLERATLIFGVQPEQIVVQALKEFFEKHGIRRRLSA